MVGSIRQINYATSISREKEFHDFPEESVSEERGLVHLADRPQKARFPIEAHLEQHLLRCLVEHDSAKSTRGKTL